MKRIRGKVRLALIGTGGISRAHARGILANSDRIECVALCDVVDQNLDARSEQLGGVSARFNDWRAMLAECGDRIDAVDICLPHHLHARAILDAVAAGKHVLCEKPMCTNLKDAARIVKAVRDSGITYMSAHNQLFMPAVRKAREMLDAGDIGRLFWLRSQDCFVCRADFSGQWRGDAKLQGGGELIDTGYHPTYRLLYLAGSDIVGVRGSFGRLRMGIDGEDTASVQVRFANGVLGEILTSWAFANPYGTHQIHMLGEKGQLFGSGSRLYYLPDGCAEPAVMNLPEVDTFVEQIRYFADCLRTGSSPIHGPAEGKQVLEVILKATKDAAGWETCA